MNQRISRRIVPIALFVKVLFGVLILIEALLISGVFQLRASTVARVAPWATEPFLKLVGEHPDSPGFRQRQEEQQASAADSQSTMEIIAGFDPDALIEDDSDDPAVSEEPAEESGDESVEEVDDDIPVG